MLSHKLKPAVRRVFLERDMDEETQHLNWIRHACLEQAVTMNKHRSVDQVIETAKKFEAYVLDKKPGQVIQMVEPNDQRHPKEPDA